MTWLVSSVPSAFGRMRKYKISVNLEYSIESTFSDYYVMAIGGPDNFREDIFKDYKKSPSRVKSKSLRPSWFKDLKLYAIECENTVVTDNIEADDQIRIWAGQLKKFGTDFVVCSVDKDLDCISGNHYNPVKRIIYRVTHDDADYFYLNAPNTGVKVVAAGSNYRDALFLNESGDLYGCGQGRGLGLGGAYNFLSPTFILGNSANWVSNLVCCSIYSLLL